MQAQYAHNASLRPSLPNIAAPPIFNAITWKNTCSKQILNEELLAAGPADEWIVLCIGDSVLNKALV